MNPILASIRGASEQYRAVARARLWVPIAAAVIAAAGCLPTPGASSGGGGASGHPAGGGTGGAGGTGGGSAGTVGGTTGGGVAGTGASGGAGAAGGVAGADGAAGVAGNSGDGGPVAGTTGSEGGSAGTAKGGAGGGGRGGAGAAGSGGSADGGGSTGRGGSTSADGGAGTGGAAGSAGAADRQAAQVLDGFAVLKPCVSSFRPSGNASNSGDCCCEELAANENQHITKQFGGDPNVTYNVKLRVAGVAERYWYAGGTLDSTSKVFYAGGLPTIHSASAPNNNLRPGQGACKIHPPETDAEFALPFMVPVEVRPSDGCYNGFNVFAFTVASPKQSYYLNDTVDFDGIDRQPHTVYKTDYTITIAITGQARLDFYTIDGDHHQVTNNGTMMVPNLKTAQPYNGNFLELTVVDVTRAN